MTRVPALADIEAAELRVIQSRRNVQQSVQRTRSALRAVITRPSTLVLVALVSGVTSYLLTPRRRPSVNKVPSSADSTIKATSLSLLRTFISIYGARVLSLALQLGAAAGKKNSEKVNANLPVTSNTGATTTFGATN